jgi:hypothetical protein
VASCPHQPVLGFGGGASCPISIALNGSISSGACTFQTDVFTVSISGTLTIDRACHVVGSMTFNLGDQLVEGPVSLWRSADGDQYDLTQLHSLELIALELIAGL